MRVWIGLIAGVLGGIGVVSALASLELVTGGLSAALQGVVVVLAGLGTNLVARRRRSATRADAEDGVETEIARRSAAAALPVAILAILALGLWATVDEQWQFALLCYAAAVAVVVAHWLAYAVWRRRTL